MIRIKDFVVVGLLTAALSSGCAPTGGLDEPVNGNGNANTVGKVDAPKKEIPSGVQARVEAALRHARQRELLTVHSFWTVIHGILANGMETTLRHPQTGEHINAIEYICNGGKLRGLEFIPLDRGVDVSMAGEIFARQGHQDQFIAEVAQIGLPLDRTFKIQGKEYKFEDFLRYAKERASTTKNQELSWTILAISQYYGTKGEWTNMFGEKVRFEDLVRYEMEQPVHNAACGGTHRLFGLTWAYYKHLQDGGKSEGVWKEVAEHLERHKHMAKEFQNPDGCFSTEYLKEKGNAMNVDRRIGSTGHVLEWLALYLPDEELSQQWMQDAANALSTMILQQSDATLDGGALGHAAHGLHIYYTRLFGSNSDPHRGDFPLPPK